jgi:hypothetical protein
MTKHYLQQIIHIFYLSLSDKYYPERLNIENNFPSTAFGHSDQKKRALIFL